MNFSLQTPSAPSPPPQAASLPPVDRPTRRRARGRKVPVLLGVVLAVAAVGAALGFPGVRKGFAGLFKTAASDAVLYRVVNVKLPVTVNEHGNLESSNNSDVHNEVEGSTTIIFILPEGTPVKKGEKVCELDSAALRDSLINQEIQTRKAEADYQNALKTREVAEIAVNEYIQGTHPQDTQTIQGEIKLAESDLERAKDRLSWSNKMYKISYISLSQLISDQLSFQKAEISKANSNTKMKVLKDFTYNKDVKELQAAVQKAKADELSKEATLQLEKTKEKKYRDQIQKCVLLAPGDGLVVYGNDADKMRGQSQVMIEEGASVRERQKIFSLPDITHMRVNTKINEAMVQRVDKGLPARIRVDSLPLVPLTGTVQSVQPMPDSAGWMSSDVKMYTSYVSVDGYNSGLRPGMSAQVEILVTQLDNVLAVPVQAVFQAQGKDFVLLKTPEGIIRREIKVGITNQRLIEVKDGLKSGDDVAMNWTSLLSVEEKNALFSANKSAAGKGKGEWSGDQADKAKTSAPAPGEVKKEPAKAKGKGGRGGGAGMSPEIMAKMQNISADDRAKMRSPDISEEDRAAILKGAGFSDSEIDMMKQMRSRMGGGGPGGPGGGGGRGGPGGGGPGGGGPG